MRRDNSVGLGCFLRFMLFLLPVGNTHHCHKIICLIADHLERHPFQEEFLSWFPLFFFLPLAKVC